MHPAGVSKHNGDKGIVHFEINFSYVLAYPKGIQDVGDKMHPKVYKS